jgi:RES domain-containing protein
MSGAGAAVHGGRFNPKGMDALYLSLTIMTAIGEASQGFAFKIEPYVLCSYEVDCADIADLRTDAGRVAHAVEYDDLACAWLADVTGGKEPRSCRLSRRLIADGHAGALVPSFAPGARSDDYNLVLWNWSQRRPHKVAVFDPSGRLPKNQLSWD